MKKIKVMLLGLLLITVLMVGLVACNGQSGKKTFNNADLIKVDKAFTGVENSMNKSMPQNASNINKAKNSGLKILAGMNKDEALNAIWNTYVAGDKQSNTSPELNYDEPPMVQFRYLKAIFEEMGDDFSLGTKYYYDITGTIYFDMETGFKTDKKTDENKYDYVFGFSLSIELLENDLIFAEVGFAIKLSKGNNEYNTSWYVCFDLNYNFSNNDPTYTLSMYTDNKESELVFLNRNQGYELDYVNMENGTIKEWRKFVLESDKAIVIDESHPSLESYGDSITYSAGTAKWYKNQEFYKITQMNAEKNKVISSAFVDGLGMNTTSINASAFLNKQGTINPVIDTYYKKICEVYGGDIIYDLVCKKEDNNKDGGNGNGNNEQQSGANWSRATENSGIPEVVPVFLSASATFSVEFDRENNAWLISYENIGENDIHNYCNALESAGFINENSGNYYYVAEGNNQVIYVSVTAINGAIIIGISDMSDSIVSVPYGLDFHGEVSGQNVIMINSVKDIGEIETISDGFITTNELDNLIVGDDKSCIVDITISYGENLDTTVEDYAQSKAKEYGALYMSDNSWMKINNNTISYKTLDSFDVIIVISQKVENKDPHILVYVLLVPEKNAERIINNSSNPDINGEGGNGGSDTGETGGEGEEGGENGGQVNIVNVLFIYLDGQKKVIRTDTQEFEEGTLIDLNALGGPEQRAYYNKDCTEEITTPDIKATEGLEIYLFKKSDESQVKQATFTIYDVGENENSIGWQDTFEVGNNTYYGYSFEYVVYWNESCTDIVPINYNFVLPEEGITVYRKHKLYEDYVSVNIEYYLNDTLCEKNTMIYRRGKVYNVINRWVIDYDSYSYYDGESEFYLKEGRGEEDKVLYGSYVAFVEDQTTIYGYGSNESYGVYTILSGEKEIANVVTNVPQYYDQYKELYAESVNVDKSQHTITFINAHKWKSHTINTVWDGRILKTEINYFDGETSFMYKPGPSDIYFTDISCKSPVVFNEDGECIITTSTTWYTPFEP